MAVHTRHAASGDATLATLWDEPAAAIVRIQAEVLRHRTFDAAAAGFVTVLARETASERVSLGLLRAGTMEVLAISGHPGKPQENAEIRELASLLDEAASQGITLSTPQSRDRDAISLAHGASNRRRSVAICTVPLVAGGAVVGATSLERGGAQAFTAAEVETLEHVICLIGPVLYLLRRDEMPWRVRLAGVARETLDRFKAPEARRARMIAAGVLVALVLLFAVPVDRHVAGRARVEGTVQRTLVAPSDGFVQAAYARAGDLVQAGQILFELADKDLQLEKRKWASQVAQYENAYAGAVSRADRVAAAVNMAKFAEAQASLALAESKLARAQVAAPFDGVVIKGDLSQSIGAPVQQGETLLTIARTDGYRMIVEVDERDIRPVRVGQKTSLTLSSAPWTAFAGEVTRITPVATTVEGANVFEVEAKLLERSNDVRAGLRGVAKITAGRQPFVFGMLRRVVDWLRLWLWSWGA